MLFILFTSHSKTQIDNIFSDVLSCGKQYLETTATISDYLPQFSFASNVLSYPSCNKSNIRERDWSKFKKKNYILDYFDKNQSEKFQLDQQNVNPSMEVHLDNINSILDTYAPLNRVDKYKLKFQNQTMDNLCTPEINIC